MRISNPAELIAELARMEARISLDEDGRLVVDVPGGTPFLLQRACRRWRGILRWGLTGAQGGYRWVACGACGDLTLAQSDRGPCLARGCPGRTRAIPLPLFLPGPPPAPAPQVQPSTAR
jgi:hypothetical protein